MEFIPVVTKAKERYFILLDTKEFKEVEGQKVVIGDVECFLHKDGKFFKMSEAKTGIALIAGSNLKRNVLESVAKNINRNYEWMLETIKNSIAENGLSPKFQ